MFIHVYINFMQAGQKTGDRLWRMPLYRQYSKQIESHFADISNVGSRGRYVPKPVPVCTKQKVCY